MQRFAGTDDLFEKGPPTEAALPCCILARLLSQFAIDQLPDAIGCHFLEHGFGRSGRDLNEAVRQVSARNHG